MHAPAIGRGKLYLSASPAPNEKGRCEEGAAGSGAAGAGSACAADYGGRCGRFGTRPPARAALWVEKARSRAIPGEVVLVVRAAGMVYEQPTATVRRASIELRCVCPQSTAITRGRPSRARTSARRPWLRGLGDSARAPRHPPRNDADLDFAAVRRSSPMQQGGLPDAERRPRPPAHPARRPGPPVEHHRAPRLSPWACAGPRARNGHRVSGNRAEGAGRASEKFERGVPSDHLEVAVGVH